ncbi:MAG: N-acetyl sugar amidotransferase [Myxococcota bacterium]|nr:N-acetyl sugar amidotransferase [Myxococcota bacterium]
MKYCTRCVYPENHALGIIFDADGICSGCKIHEEKDALPWQERLQKLKAMVAPYKNSRRSIHDCVVPITGSRDSYYIVYVVKNILGLHPLLVNYNKHYNTRMGIRNMAYLRTQMGCDFMQCTVSPQRVKKITRETLKRRGSMYWHCIAGQTVYPVQVAVNFRIPLIIWGAHQGVDQVGMFSHTDEVEMTRKYRKNHDLMGLEAEDLLQQSALLQREDVEQFVYPHDKEIESVGVRGIYLNNYLRWDTKAQHESMIEAHGYETMLQQRTMDTYNDVDCFHYSGIHDYTKFIKHGYGKISDHVSREIRLRRITREEGIDLVHRYEPIQPRDLQIFLNWLEMNEGDFWSNFENMRSSKIWDRLSNGAWMLKDSVVNHRNDPGVGSARLDNISSCDFQNNPPRDPNPIEDGYQLLGRGWVDQTPRPVPTHR